MTEPKKNVTAAKHWIIETPEGDVLRASKVGLILSGSDPHRYTDDKLARKVAEDFVAMMSVHGVVLRLNVKAEVVL